MQRFYAVDDVPVHSCLLMPTREAALSYPRGDLRLAFCPACGFVANTVFDVAHNEYSPGYEETQGFSPTFNAFARDLARQLVDRYELHGKTILEIGCGKGEFLTLLCELGQCRGIGIDPAYRADRVSTEAAARIEFIQDLYDHRYAHLAADVVVCRHTLEHIAPTARFMRDLRHNIGDRADTLVFFELPDVLRQLKEGAFWDLYYEHCSYFSAGSLARLFRLTGFDLIDLDLAYDGQYILVIARPTKGPTAPALDLENDLEELTRYVADFPRVCGTTLNRWHGYITRNVEDGRRVVIWGSSSKGVSLLTTLNTRGRVEYVVDINPYKHGKFMPGTGQEIVPPDFLREYKPHCVVVMNPIYLDEIGRTLQDMGLRPELVAV
jgi:SAM-dependent methyltransferase